VQPAPRKDPAAPLRRALARLAAQQRQIASALTALERRVAPAPTTGSGADEDDPRLAAKHCSLAHDLGAQGRYAEAEAHARRAASLNPFSAPAHNNLGWIRDAQGDRAGAIGCYRQALEANPLLLIARDNLVRALLASGRFDEALALCDAWLGRAPGDPDTLAHAVDTAMESGELERAGAYAHRLSAVRRASRWYPSPRPDVPYVAPAQPPLLSAPKLRHDIEQLRHLQERGLLPPELGSTIADYERLLPDIEALGDDKRVPLGDGELRRIGGVYGRIVHVRPTPRVPRALSGTWSSPDVEARYLGEQPAVVVVDDFLSPEALESLRQFCLESTIWSANQYTSGYLGAMFGDGFNCPLLLQIAGELKRAMPRVIGAHPLRQLWGYKYDSTLSGIATHADFAAVNVNFWLTPDAANLDPEGGGLIVYDVKAPLDWDFDSYNQDVGAMRAFVLRRGARATHVPYRQNRAVIFDSDLFHETAPLSFRPGYENRRINVTMLFGTRGPPR
jgi:Tfp pilus assembly protein PilF